MFQRYDVVELLVKRRFAEWLGDEPGGKSPDAPPEVPVVRPPGSHGTHDAAGRVVALVDIPVAALAP